jgi:LacI family transcriptional regulator
MSRVSIKGVAELAGVSTMTVSRVLRGEGDSRYYDQVMEAVRQLDYVPVRSVKQNQHIKTNTIGVLMDNEFSFDSLVGLRTFSGITKSAFAGGYDLTLLQPKQHCSLIDQKMQVLDRRCDGFVFVVPFERSEVLEVLVKNQFPAVTCYSSDVPPGVHCVVPDNGTAAIQAVQLLHGNGHRNIAYWTANRGHSDARERADAYARAAQDHGLQPHVLELDGMAQDLIIDILLSRKITAVICHNDGRALNLWTTANARGIQVPRDLSIVGIDDIEEAAWRGLTTFYNPFRTIGEEAVNVIISLLEGTPVSETCKRIPMQLLERASVGPVRNN